MSASAAGGHLEHSVQQSQQNVNQSKQMCTTCPRVDPFLSDIPPGRLAVLAGLAAAPAVQCCDLYTCLASPGVSGHAGHVGHVGAAAGGAPRGGGGGGQQREVGGGGRQGDRHGQLQTLQPALTTHRRQKCNDMYDNYKNKNVSIVNKNIQISVC